MPNYRMVKRLLYHLKGIIGLMLAVFTAVAGHAQCGSSGDPIVNITFGTADNPSLEGGTTTYDPVLPGQTPNGEGWYKLVSNINHGLGSWHNLRDHTGDADGMMVVFNADDYPGEFYRIRVSGLCENTRFRFSAWIANANRAEECNGNPIPPNVRFVIEDMDGNQVNAPYATENIAPTSSPQWLPYGFEFNTGNQTEFDLVLINDNPGGCGNDLAIDDIQFTPCGPPISLDMDETLKQGDTLFFCDGGAVPIRLSGLIAPDDSYAAEPVFQWQTRRGVDAQWTDIPGERRNELDIMPIDNQWYRLTAAASADNLSEPLCRISSEPIRIAQLVPQADVTDIDETAPLCEGGSILLNPPEYIRASAGPITYQWRLDDGSGLPISIPEATSRTYEFIATEAGIFHLIRQAVNGCGDRFATHIFEVLVNEPIRTSLTLLQPALCADDDPLPLAGGVIVNGSVDMVGAYSGIGVVNGVFYPAVAGVGQHTITFSPPQGTPCPLPSQAIITVYDTISIGPMLDVVMLPNQRITLRPQTNASQFRWSNEPGLDNYHTQYPVASPAQTTTYTLTASNAVGCEKTETVTITVLNDLIVPNGFTPNGDNVNDTWEIEGLRAYPNVFIQVFNRWGTLVFSSKGYTESWAGQYNGAPLPTGTYYYTLSSDILEQPLSGSVSIFR